jgi:hypothetical protein
MFPFQQMAGPLMPQAHAPQAQYILCFAAYSGGGCHICTGTCYDTCAGTWGCGGYSWACGDSRIYLTQAVAAQDPELALQELRKGLELALAGVVAQERVLHERKSQAQGQKP